MDKKAYQGAFKVSGWASDYNRLKSAKNIRNELAHSRNSFSTDICSQEDIDFIRSFRARILNQADPISMLRKQTNQTSSSSASQKKQQTQPTYSGKTHTGCLGIVASFLVVAACVIAFFL